MGVSFCGCSHWALALSNSRDGGGSAVRATLGALRVSPEYPTLVVELRPSGLRCSYRLALKLSLPLPLYAMCGDLSCVVSNARPGCMAFPLTALQALVRELRVDAELSVPEGLLEEHTIAELFRRVCHPQDPSQSEVRRKFQPQSCLCCDADCDACDGSCDSGCDGGCDRSCDSGDASCDASCDTNCDTNCDSSCDGSCDSSCDSCCGGVQWAVGH